MSRAMSMPSAQVEVFAVQRRRRFSAEEKQRLVQETLQPEMTISLVARQHKISPSLLFRWRTHRVEAIPEGGMIIHLNDNCAIVLTPFPFPICSPFKRKANGDLFKHMHDPEKPGNSNSP